MTDLQAARQQAQHRYAELGRAWVERFDIRQVEARKSLTGRAYTESRRIQTPWPTTTRKRLYVLAHEIGHVALGHKNSQPSYVKEYEAEKFAITLMQQAGVPVPRSMLQGAKKYVALKIRRALRHGARGIDAAIARWAGVKLPEEKAVRTLTGERASDRIACALARTKTR